MSLCADTNPSFGRIVIRYLRCLIFPLTPPLLRRRLAVGLGGLASATRLQSGLSEQGPPAQSNLRDRCQPNAKFVIGQFRCRKSCVGLVLRRDLHAMSIQAITWVIEQSESRLGPRHVLISIANHARPDGTGAWPSIATIAHEAKLSEREVQRSLRTLALLGELEVYDGLGPHGTHYFVLKKMLRPRCWYCGKDLFAGFLTVDHQVPKALGGENSLDNLVYCCEECNSSKRTKTVEDYRETGQVFFAETTEGRQFVTRPDQYRGVKSIKTRKCQMTNPTGNLPLDVENVTRTVIREPSLKERKPSMPVWMPLQSWNDFVEMRKRIRAPLTDRGKTLAITTLSKLVEQGNDAQAVIEQSVMNSWRGLFPLRENGHKPQIGVGPCGTVNPKYLEYQRLKAEGKVKCSWEEWRTAPTASTRPASTR